MFMILEREEGAERDREISGETEGWGGEERGEEERDREIEKEGGRGRETWV